LSEINKGQSRDKAVEAAEILLFSQGYDSVTMGYPVRRSAFYAPTLRLFFNDRESLYLSAVMSGMRTLNAMYIDHTESEATGLERLSALGRAISEYSRRCPDDYRSIYGGESCDLYNEPMAAVISCVESEAVGNELGQTELVLYLIALSIGIVYVDVAWKSALGSAGLDGGRFAADFPGFISNVMNAIASSGIASHDHEN
jgi:hypothetical protein